MAAGIVFSLQTWCIQKGGPVFVAVFQPMQTLLVAAMVSRILGDQLYVGGYAEIKKKITKRNLLMMEISRFIKLFKFILLMFLEILVTCRIIGAALIMLGLSSVLWVKTEEKRSGSQDQEQTLTKHLIDTETRVKDDAPESDIP